MAARHFAIQRDLVSFHRRERQQQEVQEHQVQQERQPHHCPVSPDEQEQKHEQQESLQDHNILSKEEWIHSQQGVNDAVERLMRQKSLSSSSSSSSLSSTTSSTRCRHDRRDRRRHHCQMTIIQTDMTMSPLQQQHPLRCLGLFRALRYTGMIHSLSLVGIAPQLEQDEQSCQALAQALHTSPTLSRLHITHLSIFSSPTLSSLLSSLCHVLTTTTTNVASSPQDMSSPLSSSSSSSRCLALRDLRLAFRDDFRTSPNRQEQEQQEQQQYSNTQQLLHALTKCAGLLQCLHLFGLNLSQFETTDLVTLVQEHNQSLQELKLVRCNLGCINQLCHAMMTTTTTKTTTTTTTTTTMVNHENDKVNGCSGYTSWTKIDFSMNHIRCLNDLAPLLRMTSKNDHDDNKNNDNNNHYYRGGGRGGLTELSLSQNNLCGDCPRSNNNNDMDDDDIDDNNVDGKLFCHALATNTTLLRLSLDLNPLSQSFGTNLYHVLTHDNTTLLRLSVVVWGKDNQYHHSRSSNGVLSFSSHGHGHGRHCIRLLSQTCVAQLRMAVAMNEAGRKWLHQQPNALPQLMARVQHEPTLLYGLLQEQEQLYFV